MLEAGPGRALSRPLIVCPDNGILAREMLYRACELNVNHPDSADKAMGMYMRVAELVENLGRAERAIAEAELIRASFGEDKTSKCIDSWLDKDVKNVNTLKEWLAKKELKISLALFIHAKNYAGERLDFTQTQGIPCNN